MFIQLARSEQFFAGSGISHNGLWAIRVVLGALEDHWNVAAASTRSDEDRERMEAFVGSLEGIKASNMNAYINIVVC